MPSPGSASLTSLASGTAVRQTDARRGSDWLREARDVERDGAIPEAVECYELAIAEAERNGERGVLAEALRRLAVLRHHQNDSHGARDLCRRSYELAMQIGSDLLAAEALNTFGGLDLMTGSLAGARAIFVQALALGGSSRELCARVEQNLGILANIQGDVAQALAHYERSLDAYRECGNEHGCAIAYHNLGMVSADRQQYAAADFYFSESRALAEKTGNGYLRALCLVNHAETDVARQRFENARQSAEQALALFDELGVRGPKHDAYRVLGMVYRETGRSALAESRLRSAVDFAVAAGSVLGEAEASRELALLHQGMGRNQEALRLLNVAHGLFRRLDARVDLVDVGGKVAELKSMYLAVVRAWGESIESSDSHTFGHCERVAQNAVAMARVLGFDDQEETTLLLGAYLHDLGKVRVPHEILHKASPLNRVELEVVQMHPIWGIELLSTIEFPWAIKPIIRWHHERYDGTGYPDRLKGDDIPVAAQVVGILDFYDALITARPHQAALPPDQALAYITRCQNWWSERVFAAFRQVIARSA